jgi:hypothetical protein
MLGATYFRPGFVIAALVLAVFMLAGCGATTGRYAVEGSVNLNNEPVDGGVIMFLPLEATAAEGGQRTPAQGEIKGGKYSIDAANGPSAGKYRVEIVWNKKTGKKKPPEKGEPEVDETAQVVPLAYNLHSKSVVEVKAGQVNKFDFLELKGPPPTKAGDTPKKGD